MPPFARYRCRFEIDPRKGGCRRKGAGCTYTHREDPEWEKAPPPPSRAKDNSNMSRGGTHAAASSARDAGGNTGAVDGWGAWGTETGWGTNGWDIGGSTSNNPSTTTSQNTSALVRERNQADTVSTANGNTRSGEHGWGGGAEQATGSGWGSTGNDGWASSNWGDTDKAAGSGWGDNQSDEWGASWGNKDANKDAGSTWGNAQNGGWGSGWGDNKDTTNSWGAPDPMIVDNRAEKGTKRNKGKGKVVPVPPRIRIPDNENKKAKISGTNNEPLGPSRWGEPLSSNLVTTSTPEATSTPVTTITPTDSTRVKRKRDVASDDKLDLFKEYVKTWERGVRARFLLAEAETRRKRWFGTQKSACYARIGEAGRKRLDGQRAECDQEVSLQSQKLSSAITSLVQFHDRISSNLDLGQRYNIGEEAEKFITESKAFVDEVRALLVAHILKDKNKVQSGDTQKRTSGAKATSFDSLRNQARDLEERFDQAQTELTLRHQRDIRSEIDELLAAKITTLRAARQLEVDRVALQPRAEIVIPPSVLGDIERTAQQVKELDAKVPKTVEDIRVLLLRVDATTKRVSELEEELSMNKATYEKVQDMAAEREETERKMDERLEKIREQFEQLVASQGLAAQPTISPTIYDSRDKLMESLRPAFEAVLDKFYEQEVRPTIESLQRVVIQTSDRHQEEAIKVLWGKIQPAMNMVAGVSRWLDSQELGLTAPQGL